MDLPPTIFNARNLKKWPKIWCTLANIVGICWGNCTKLSCLMCPHRGIKCVRLILGVLLPKNFGGEKRSFQLRHFATLLQISPDWNKISSTGKWRRNCDHSRTCLPNLLNFGPRRAKTGPFFHPLKISFLDAHISGVKGRCSLKLSQF